MSLLGGIGVIGGGAILLLLLLNGNGNTASALGFCAGMGLVARGLLAMT